ncbi:MAG: hypothetical protein ACQEVA_03870 [Myxococcota bacterium]
MLYEEATTGAIVAGVELESDAPWTARQAEDVRDALREHNLEHGTRLRLIVPGDTTTEHEREPDRPLYGWGVLIGLLPFQAKPSDGPHEIDVGSAQRALREVQKLQPAFWRELADRHALLAALDQPRPQLFLTSFGPLPKALLAVGQKRAHREREQARYRFFGIRDMDQRRIEEGVDGIDIASVDFADFVEIDLSPAAVASWLSKVDKLDEPGLFLSSRTN